MRPGILRRLIRFNLRTFLAAVGAVCLWLGWNVSVVRERNYLRGWIVEHHGGINFDGRDGGTWKKEQQRNDAALSWLRRLLGDRAAVIVAFPTKCVSLAEIERVERAFPEAYVVAGVRHGPSPVYPQREDGVKIPNWPPPSRTRKPLQAYFN